MKASEAKQISLQNWRPSEMEMQGIYNAIRDAAKRGYLGVTVRSPAQRQAAMKILSDLGYRVSWSEGDYGQTPASLHIKW